MQVNLEDWFAEDFGNGDVTSLAVVPNEICKAKITGGPGIISGLEICSQLLESRHIEFKTNYKDGDSIVSNLIFSLN